MAKIPNGILGAIVGSLENITGYRRNESDIIQKKIGKGRDNSSVLQLHQQLRFLNTVNYIKLITSYFLTFPFTSNDKYWNNWNYAMTVLVKAFDFSGIQTPELLEMAEGEVYESTWFNVQYSLSGLLLSAGFTNTVEKEPGTTEDTCQTWLYNATTKEFIHNENVTYRNSGRFAWTELPAWNLTDKLYLYVVWQLSPDYAIYSNTTVLEVTMVA